MTNILLICSAGMSTSALVSRMEKAAEEKGMEVNVWAVGDALAEENISKADVVLLGPQVKFQEQRIRGFIKDNTPLAVINMQDYGMMNGAKVLQQALDLIEKK